MMVTLVSGIASIINLILYGGFGLSSLITTVNVLSSNSRIKKKGNAIKPITANSVIENIKYAIKDYGFLLIPIYNIIKSVKDFVKKDAVYDAERLAKLTDRNRIGKCEEVKVEEPSKKVVAPVKKEERTAVRPATRPAVKVVETTPARPVEKPKTVETMTCYERRSFYEAEYRRLCEKHAAAKRDGKSITELNSIKREIDVVCDKYRTATNDCKLAELRELRNELYQNLGKSRRLRQK